MKSIFKKRNKQVETLFESAGASNKVMCVAFDYAKAEHKCVICDGMGHQLHKSFNVINNREGLEFLMDKIGGLCRKHVIKLEHVFFGGEDCGSYIFNFIHALIDRGFLVVGINPRQAKVERENSVASNDLIDTIGVAGTMIKMRGRTIGKANEDVHSLKRLERLRNALLKAHSASAHRIYQVTDQLLPDFLNQDKSGLIPFCRASLWLMDDKFGIERMRTRQKSSMIKKLRELNVGDPEGYTVKLKALAEESLPPPKEMIPALQRSLAEEKQLYLLMDKSLHNLDIDIAKQFARTPGAMLTTLQGIGLRWAPALFVELGDPLRRRNVHSMAALGGIVPRSKQTGGDGKQPVVGHRNRKCCTSLKKTLMSGAVSISQYGLQEMRVDYKHDLEIGRDARTRMAQKLLRVSLHIIDVGNFFIPPSLMQECTTQQMADYYKMMWPKVLVKWRDKGAILEATAPGAPLREWRDMAQDLYKIKLSLKSPQTGRK